MDPSVSPQTPCCTKLRVVYYEQGDCMSIAHMTQDGKVLSEACLSPEDAIEYARSIIAVYDEAMDIE
jgi:hypothetical protein